MTKRLLSVAWLLLLTSCATVPLSINLDPNPNWCAPPLERAVSVRDGRTGETLSFEKLLDSLARAEVVFLGEQHTDETTHRVELAVYEGLLARRNGKVVLALEMFERDVQHDLDAYLAGQIDEATFLSRARPWGNYPTAYRPLIEHAKASKKPVVAANFPAPLRQKLAQDGPGVLAALEGDARREAPIKLLPETPEYWRRADNAIRSHRAMMGGTSDEDRLYSTQSLWDNAMGEACALTLDAHPGHSVLHVNGGFHTAYWDGTVRQLQLRRPAAKVLTVEVVPVANPATVTVEGLPVADYIVFAQVAGTEAERGRWSVQVSRPADYRLHMPANASATHRVPLIIWLGDDGLTAADGIELWKQRLGDQAAIAALEPLYPQVEADFSQGGRWFTPDSFSTDIDALVTAIEAARGYVLRHFAVDPTRVCLAGEGTGATVVAATALLSEHIDVAAVACEPRNYAKIKDFSLPLPELRGKDRAPRKSLSIVAGQEAAGWWRDELHEYDEVGLKTTLTAAGADLWGRELDEENALRAAMGVERRSPAATAERRYVLTDSDTPRARFWARLITVRNSKSDLAAVVAVDAAPAAGGATRFLTETRAESFAAPGMLPKCPGAFGGTTVVVVPDGAEPAEVAAWVKLEADDPIKKESRFHRLVVARNEDQKHLPEVLATLRAANRKNVLIVPAVFCADVGAMRALERSVRPLADTMTIQWLPGLGGQIGVANP